MNQTAILLVAGALLGGPLPAAAAAAEASPCSDEAFRAFDFWLGDWEVRTADGRLAGHNRIESAHGGCVILEHWTGTAGMTGMSMNYLDGMTDEWVQVWMDASGDQAIIRGGPTADEKGMRLEGKLHSLTQGQTGNFRGIWTVLPDGRIRQLFELSADGGRTWSTWFEGFYTRAETVPGAGAQAGSPRAGRALVSGPERSRKVATEIGAS
jgi:hypothetical protein